MLEKFDGWGVAGVGRRRLISRRPTCRQYITTTLHTWWALRTIQLFSQFFRNYHLQWKKILGPFVNSVSIEEKKGWHAMRMTPPCMYILLIINPSTGMDQEIHPFGQGRIDRVKTNPSLLRMREFRIWEAIEGKEANSRGLGLRLSEGKKTLYSVFGDFLSC